MNGVRKSREASFRVCATRTTPGVTHRRRSYLEDLQNRGTCRAAAGHLHASCLRRQYVSSPPTSGFFLTCQHVWGPTSQGPRVPGSQGHRGTILPRSCRESVANGARPSPCDTWRPPRPRPRQRDTPPPPQRRAEGGAPGILAPCLSHPGSVPSNLAVSLAVPRGASEASRHPVAWPGCVSPRHSRCSRAASLSGSGPEVVCCEGPAARLRGARRGRNRCPVHMKSRSALRGAVDAVRGRCGAPESLRESRDPRRRVADQRAQGALASAAPAEVFGMLCSLSGAWVA